MRNTLLIQLADSTSDRARWVTFDGAGAAPAGVQEGVLAEVAGQAPGRRVLVLVPTTEVLLTQAHVPSHKRQRVLKAVPFALEEQLAGEIDDLHFALGSASGEDHPVAVVANDRMDAWLASCAEAGLQPDALLPDALALPLIDGHWTLQVRGGIAAVRSGPLQGFGCEADNLVTLLRLWDEAAVPALRVLGNVPSQLASEDFVLDPVETRDSLLLMAEALADGVPINLLQGRYSRSEQLSRLWKPWRATAALLVAGLVLASVYSGVNYYRMGQLQQQLAAEIEAVFRRALPDVRKLVNPRAQLQQRLDALQRGQGGGEVDFMALLAKAGPALRGSGGVEVQGANYRDGQLDLELTVESLQLLDQLKQQLSQQAGLAAEIQSATADADRKVKSRIRISGVGS